MGKMKELFIEELEKRSGDREAGPHYNHCFVLGGKAPAEGGALVKVPMFIRASGRPGKLWGGKDGQLRQYYELSYEQASGMLSAYLRYGSPAEADRSLRVSLYLDNAMYGGLHVFVIDFDRFDTESCFFKAARAAADKVTRSQGGGYHMFYGVNKRTAAPLFDSINLLASSTAKSFIRSTRKVTLDGANKVDMFCDARQLVYEWEPWDNSIGLTDKTLELYHLIRNNFELKRPKFSQRIERRCSLQEQIEDLSRLTGYPAGFLLEVWEDMEDKDLEYFKAITLELDW